MKNNLYMIYLMNNSYMSIGKQIKKIFTDPLWGQRKHNTKMFSKNLIYAPCEAFSYMC